MAIQAGHVHGDIHIYPDGRLRGSADAAGQDYLDGQRTGQRLRSPTAPFARSWTGNDPMASYSHRVKRLSWRTWAVGSMVSAVTAYVGIVLSVSLDPTLFRLNEIQISDDPRVRLIRFIWFAVFVAGCFLLAFCTPTCIYCAVVAKRAALPPRWRPWRLYLGPDCIVAATPDGRSEFTWDRVKKVTIREIHSWSTYHSPGSSWNSSGTRSLRTTLRSRAGRTRQGLSKPPGWGYPPAFSAH